MSVLPIFLKMQERRVLVVGAGSVALGKIESLLPLGARVHVVAPHALAAIHAYAREGTLAWSERGFVAQDLEDVSLVIAATNVPQVNQAVHQAAVEHGILCNSVDNIPNCDFFFGSIVQRGELRIAISTNGESPALAQRLRSEIDAQLPEDLGPWLEQLGELRRQVLRMHPGNEDRKSLLHQLAQRSICESPLCASRQLAISGIPTQNRNASEVCAGKVHLVGAGPGDPELLTVRALRLIQSADVILHDDLVPHAILTLASPQASIVDVGKRCGTKLISQEEIHPRMIDAARCGQRVVRLKSGDPVVYGRLTEEIAALTEAQIDFEIVPGITAASAAAVAAGCSLTERGRASGLMISTAHHAHPRDHERNSMMEDSTRVVYMPGRDLGPLAEEWLRQGLPEQLPCAIVSHASRPEQTVLHTTLGELAKASVVAAPSVLLAGWAIRNVGADSDEPAKTLSATS